MQLVLFDLDNTLLDGDSDFQWAQFLIEQGVLDGEAYRQKNLQFYQNYKEGVLDIYAFLHFQLQPLAQHSQQQLNEWHRCYMQQKVLPMISDTARQLVARHRTNPDNFLVLITATNSFVTAPIARELGIPHLIATEPEEVNGQFTGRVKGLPSFREGKVARLESWLAKQNLSKASFETSWFYSDSHNDLPLLQWVDHPVAVNPDPALKTHAEQQGWPVLLYGRAST